MEGFRYEGNPNEPNLSTVYPQDYFLVQFAFARKWSEVTRTSFTDAVKFNTGIYYTLTGNQPRRFQLPNSSWDEMETLLSFAKANDLQALAEEAFNMYVLKPSNDFDHSVWQSSKDATNFGCFSYDLTKGKVNIHFTNLYRRSQLSPLSPQSIETRQNELRRMLQTIKTREHGNGKQIHCGSWLLNLPRFQILLPNALLENAKFLVPGESTTWYEDSLWGSFLNWRGQIKPDIANEFLERLERTRKPIEALSAFPYQVVQGECDIQCFYHMYGVA